MEPIVQLTCQRCSHGWIPNVPNPVVCPRCHSPYWRSPRKNNRSTGRNIMPNTIHQEPLVTETPQIPTPQYIPVQPPIFMGQPVIRTYPPPGEGLEPVDYTQPPVRFPSPPVYTEVHREPPTEYIIPDKDMPLPLRKCKLCGYKGYGDSFKNHNCRR